MVTKLNNDNNDLIKKLNSLALALMITSACITGVLVKISALANFQNNLIVLGLVFFCMFASFIVNRKIVFPMPSMIVMGYVILLYLVTLLFQGTNCDLSGIQFVFYVIVPIYLISQSFDSEYVLRCSLYISLISLPVINSFFVLQYEQYSQAYMGNIYAILSPVIIAFIHFKLYRKQANILTKIAYVYNLFVLLRILSFANRGAVLCIVFCLLILFINSYDGEKRKKLPPVKVIAIAALFVLAAFAIVFSLPLLNALASLSKEIFGNIPSFISKTITYLNEDDVLNGRSSISGFTVKAIWDSPIFGHGIETFESFARKTVGKSWPYPHNYILQLIFECGIIFSALPIFFSLSLTAKTIFCRIEEKNEFAICCTLVCINLPKLLFSTDMWLATGFWMLITYSILYTVKNNNCFHFLYSKGILAKQKC